MPRIWNNRLPDDGSIHVMGNGRLAVYGQGPDLLHIRGPWYSLPSFGSLHLADSAPLQSVSDREAGSAVWRHTITRGDTPAAVFTDCVDPDKPVFLRDITADQPLTLTLEAEADSRVYTLEDYAVGSRRQRCWLAVLPKGTPYFVGCTTPREVRLLVLAEGCAQLEPDGRTIRIEAGEGRLWFAAGEGPALPDLMAQAADAGGEACRAAQRAFCAAFLARGRAFTDRIPADHPERERLLAVFESVSLLIKGQQSFDGGIMAGHCYPLAYVRDQAGCMRGLLHMGYADEARAVLAFWFQRFERYGFLCNAEGMGDEAARLVFPNDEVEIPAYVLLCAFSYGDQTGDWEYVRSLFPMLRWAFEVQLGHLADGMTGFSGDETYIAGHTFPREFGYHGSAESTMLFIESGWRLVAFCRKTALLPEAVLARYEEAIAAAQDGYAAHFIRDGRLYANDPARQAVCPPPRFHHGFCERHEQLDGSLVLTWVERGEDGYYRCPACRGLPMPQPLPDPAQRYMLSSISLLPAYHQVRFFTGEQVASFAAPFLDLFERKGYIPSNAEGRRSLGYDFGLLLCTLTRLDHPLKEKALTTLLDIVDPTGAWVEYYDDLTPYNCRCRAWESGVNMEAIARYLEALHD